MLQLVEAVHYPVISSSQSFAVRILYKLARNLKSKLRIPELSAIYNYVQKLSAIQHDLAHVLTIVVRNYFSLVSVHENIGYELPPITMSFWAQN